MAYTRIRYIAYDVPTIGKTTPVTYRIPPGRVKSPPTLKDTDDLINLGTDGAKDALVRIQRFMKVLYKAKEKTIAGNNSNTLKVFVIPEFYFRPDNEWHSYNEAEYKAIVKALKGSIAHGDFKHWLIICGTILWYEDVKGTDRATKKPIEYKKCRSTCLYFRKKFFENQSDEIEKGKYAVIDGLPFYESAYQNNKDQKDDEVYENYPYFTPAQIKHNTVSYASDYGPTSFQEADARKHILEVNGLNVGIEICLEHTQFYRGLNVLETKEDDRVRSKEYRKGILRNSYDKGYFKDNEKLHFQILTSGGMTIKPTSLATKEGGFILRCDGYNTDDTVDSVEFRKVDHYKKIRAKWENNVTFLGDFEETDNAFDVGKDVAEEAVLTNPVNSGDIITINLHECDCAIPDPTDGADPKFNNQNLLLYPVKPIS